MRLYNRFIHSSAEKVGDDRLVLEAAFIDLVHELNVTLEVRLPDRVIIGARAEVQRAPYPVCADVAAKISGLVGHPADMGIGRAAKEALGGPQGCSHLLELALEAVRSAIQSEFVETGMGLSPDEKVEIYRRKWKDTCYAYSQD
ncbi:MAG TPA: DUF2889 domain-containing protein [Bacillota bacterium]|jgi:hypothetical protein